MSRILPILVVAIVVVACGREDPAASTRASGFVEATEVRVASKIPGRVATVTLVEGARVAQGDVLATMATDDLDLALNRAKAERAQASAQLALLAAGSRPEDIRQAEAQAAAAAADRKAAEAEVSSARADEARFQQLLDNKAGSAKQRDDAVARRELADARLRAAADRLSAASATVDRQKAGARPEEIAAARARVATVDAQMASMEHDKSEAVIASPIGGVVAGRLVEPGELVAVGTPIAIVVDLDHAWANVYVEETLVPHIRLDQAATVVTDAGDRLEGRVSFIASRAEFTPRNVQTVGERVKQVIGVKVTLDNAEGQLRAGMAADVFFPNVPK